MNRFIYKLFFGKPEYNKVIKGSAYHAQKRNLQKIWNNEKHNDIGFEKILRLFLVGIQFVFPGLHVRNYFGKFGLIKRNVANEFYVLFKCCLPLIFLYSGLYQYKVVVFIACYMMLETICYVSALIFVSDMFIKPRSYRRNILMLSLNYLEICFAFAVVYACFHLLGNQAKSLFDYIYFSIVTATTIGYGDLHPVSDSGKLMVCIQAGLALAFIVLFLNFFGSKVETLASDEETI